MGEPRLPPPSLVCASMTTRDTRAKAESAPAGIFISVGAAHATYSTSQPGLSAGRLDGVGFAAKDNIETSQLPTTAGTEALRGSWPRRDAGVIRALRSAGACLVGKTNLHELAFGITGDNGSFGPTRNPRDPDRSAGGSSSGSAAAVAEGIVPFALGTDTGGSIRIPAAHCGVVGFRPTTGRYPSTGVVPLSWTRDTVGIIARTVDDVAYVDSVMAGDWRFDTRDGSKVRLGWSTDGFGGDLAPEVAVAMREACASLVGSGITLIEVHTERLLEIDAACGFPITFFESARTLPGYLYTLDGARADLGIKGLSRVSRSPDVHLILEQLLHTGVTRRDYDAALSGRTRLQSAYAELFSANRVDALVYPTVAVTAPKLSQTQIVTPSGREWPVFDLTIRNTSPGSVAGLPSLSLPGLNSSEGLPVGLSLEAPVGSDRALLGLAACVESILPGSVGRGRPTG